MALLFAYLNLQSEALILDCTYSVTSLWKTDNVYVCTARVILVGDDCNLTESSRNHLDGMNDSDVKGVSFDGNNLKMMPRNLSKIFPNLEALQISSSQLKEIKREDLVGFRKLEVFDLYNNQIRSIAGNLFENNLQIQHIRFSENPLKHVGLNAFKNLQLHTLYLNSAGCISDYGNNRAAVERLIMRMTDSCPPSWEMIVAAKEFKEKVEVQIEEKTYPLAMKIVEIEQILMGRLSHLDKKLHRLEKVIENNPNIQLL